MVSRIIVIKSIFGFSALIACENCLQLTLGWIWSYIYKYLPGFLPHMHAYNVGGLITFVDSQEIIMLALNN